MLPTHTALVPLPIKRNQGEEVMERVAPPEASLTCSFKPSLTRSSIVLLLAIFAGTPASARVDPMDVWSGVCHAAGSVFPIIAAFCTVTDKVYDAIKPQDPITLRELYLRLVSL